MLKKHILDLSSPKVMAIINITPDSFYKGSRNNSDTEIVDTVKHAIDNGAAILDVGGYSSRPGADDVTPEEEYRRLAKGIEIIREIDSEIPVSIDTFRAEVADRIITDFGACVINDISAGELGNEMLSVVAQHKVPYIAMHMRGTPQNMQQNTTYDNVKEDVLNYFSEKIKLFRNHGIEDIIIDPGFGFSKTVDQNYELLSGLSDFKMFNLPILVGVSRKSMIWRVLETTPDDALIGTAVLNWESLFAGANILRVHDVREAMQTIKLFEKYSQYTK